MVHHQPAPVVLPTSVPTSTADMVLPFLELLSISGVALSVVSGSHHRELVATSDPIATRIEELQFELGEGPGFQVVETGVPQQFQPKMDASTFTPFFDAAVRDLDVATIISLPLRIGAVVVGVVTLHRRKPGLLTDAEMTTAAALVHWVAGPAIGRAVLCASSDDPTTVDSAGRLRREVHQATGMVMVQADLSASDAFLRLRAHAFTEGRSVHEVAADVIARLVSFSDTAS